MGIFGIGTRYLKYRMKAKNRYKVHSPFVYNLIEKVFRDNADHEDFKFLDDLTGLLKSSDQIIETVDFGAGAGKEAYKVYYKSLGKIVRERSHSIDRLHLLYNMMHYFQPREMLEFGTAAGVSTLYLKKPVPESKMVTMEGCAGLAAVAKETVAKAGIRNVEVINGNFDTILQDVLQQFDRLDFVFFDGNHRKEPTLSYFDQCMEKAHENSFFLFDDIHWSKGMEEAWERIKADERVSITIDIFWFGMVFFKKGIAKQNFVVKY